MDPHREQGGNGVRIHALGRWRHWIGPWGVICVTTCPELTVGCGGADVEYEHFADADRVADIIGEEEEVATKEGGFHAATASPSQAMQQRDASRNG